MYHSESNDPTPDHVYNKLYLENFATLLALALKLTDLVQTLCELAGHHTHTWQHVANFL